MFFAAAAAAAAAADDDDDDDDHDDIDDMCLSHKVITSKSHYDHKPDQRPQKSVSVASLIKYIWRHLDLACPVLSSAPIYDVVNLLIM